MARKAKPRLFLAHGLMQSEHSMTKMGRAFEARGYEVVYLNYQSRAGDLKAHQKTLQSQIQNVLRADHETGRVHHFIGFSMGAVLIRLILEQLELPNLGRVIFIAAPMRGTYLVDFCLRYCNPSLMPITRWSYGPAVEQLGRNHDALPRGPIDYECGVITGTGGKSLPLAWALLRKFEGGENDGRVSFLSSKIEEAQDTYHYPAEHFYLPRYRQVIEQCCHFIEYGVFDRTMKARKPFHLFGIGL